jgi:hypothetical protein
MATELERGIRSLLGDLDFRLCGVLLITCEVHRELRHWSAFLFQLPETLPLRSGSYVPLPVET